ncbi:MAG: redox-sensing transcriptional repressor Rex [Caldicoprobacterales bacterium]|jgi:redox-sensing transcriptional repressor|nr:redox-sensing transcriptional repressor Rex [Bacillota bacterium]NLH59353.1 redox-sensing transcriptional repressor Rex [Clostridiales bacterium]
MSKEGIYVSEAVIRRLPKYYRYLDDLEKVGIERVSSKELSRRMGLTASQIRQDFNCFGGFGQQGYGYNVSELKKELIKILGLDKRYNLIVIGAGNMGQALANYVAFEKEGFYIRALFDINPKLIGMTIRDIKIYDLDYLEEYIKMNPTDIAVITTPRQEAQAIADRLVTSGIKGIWNFAAVDIEVPQDVVVENAHISDSLFTLSFKTREDIKLI